MLDSWDELVKKNDLDTLAAIIGYNQIREKEESEAKEAEIKALMSIIAGSKIV
jgi:hypothetical protein